MKTVRHSQRLLVLFCTVLMLMIMTGGLHAQSSLEKALQQYASEEVKGYIQPVGDLFGANLNAGLFHSADIPKMGFHFRLELIGMGSLVGDAQKTYTANAPPGWNPGTFQTATVFGEKGGSVVDQTTGFTYRGSDGVINTSILPLAVPQISIGDLYGTRVIVRFIATPEFGDGGFPKATLLGIGVQHSVSQYFPSVPVDIAGHFFYNRFTVGDLIDVSGISIGAEASKSFSVLTLYGGLAWEKSSMNLKYTPSNTTTPLVDITLDGANNFRFTVGLGLQLAFLSLFGDANFGSVTNFSAGIGFGI